ncbi:hypothetical protein D3C76_1320270 [compost metagenome]
MQQVQRVVREGLREGRQVARDVFGIAAKVDQCIRAIMRPDGDQHPRVGDRQGEQGNGRADGARLRVVDQRPLKHEQRHAQRQVRRCDDDDE